MNIFKKLRNKLGLTQVDFAKEINVPYPTYKKWELELREPNDAALEYIKHLSTCKEFLQVQKNKK